jgi:ankyrin repeat protein
VPDPKSEILDALYRMKRDHANHLADAAGSLTIWEAAALGRTIVVATLLDAEPALANACAPDGHTPLGLACFFGAPAVARVLLARGADVSAAAQNSQNVQPLHAAVAGRNVEAVGLLLEHGAAVNARQQLGYTPLMGAAAAGREDMIDMLLRHGADPSLANDEGKTAATIAAEHGHHQVGVRLETARG